MQELWDTGTQSGMFFGRISSQYSVEPIDITGLIGTVIDDATATARSFFYILGRASDGNPFMISGWSPIVCGASAPADWADAPTGGQIILPNEEVFGENESYGATDCDDCQRMYDAEIEDEQRELTDAVEDAYIQLQIELEEAAEDRMQDDAAADAAYQDSIASASTTYVAATAVATAALIIAAARCSTLAFGGPLFWSAGVVCGVVAVATYHIAIAAATTVFLMSVNRARSRLAAAKASNESKYNEAVADAKKRFQDRVAEMTSRFCRDTQLAYERLQECLDQLDCVDFELIPVAVIHAITVPLGDDGDSVTASCSP